MADMVNRASDIGSEIKNVLAKFTKHSQDCRNICSFMEILCKDLKLLLPVPGTVMEKKIMQTTMKNLISVLERKATEAKKCRSNNLKHFEARGIAHELNMLRLKIIQEIFLSKGVTETSTYTLLNQKIDQESKEIFDKILEATKALLVPLQHKVEQPVQPLCKTNSTEDSSSKNKKEVKKPGIDYKSSELETAIASLKDDKADKSGSIFSIFGGTGSNFFNKVILYKDEKISIKKFHKFNDSNKQLFLKELNIVSKLQHRNIVKHLGHFYQYHDSLVHNNDGDFIDHIRQNLAFISEYNSDKSFIKVITVDKDVKWPRIFGIIQGIAEGVRYLHIKSIVHLDLKPENILLGEKSTTPKIREFGEAVSMKKGAVKITAKTKGDDYTAPELSPDGLVKLGCSYITGGVEVTNKCDVYSFGVILLETMSHMCKKGRNPPPKSHEQWADKLLEREDDLLFDEALVTGELQMEHAMRCVLVGMMCCLLEPVRRLSMKDVIDMLTGPPRTDAPSSSAAAATANPRR